MVTPHFGKGGSWIFNVREHGLIKKLPRQNRYMVTEKGKQLSLALQALLAASTEELMKIAA
jgi:predicted transcriptional regulator